MFLTPNPPAATSLRFQFQKNSAKYTGYTLYTWLIAIDLFIYFIYNDPINSIIFIKFIGRAALELQLKGGLFF